MALLIIVVVIKAVGQARTDTHRQERIHKHIDKSGYTDTQTRTDERIHRHKQERIDRYRHEHIHKHIETEVYADICTGKNRHTGM